MNKIHQFADFETTTDPDDCRVWSWGVADATTTPEPTYRAGIDIVSFIENCAAFSSIVWFHNLRFDGNFIISWLLIQGFVHVENTRKIRAGEFTTLISGMGAFYQITVGWLNGNTTEFRDSLKKLPMSISRVATTFGLEESKGVIDYHKHRPVGYQLTEVEEEYQFVDVMIGAKAVHQFLSQGMDRLTIGSDSLQEFKHMSGKAFKKLFPVLTTTMDAEIRKAYRGGFTYADPRFKGRVTGPGNVYDVNSLYPAVMYTEVLPYGEPVFMEGEPVVTADRPLWIASVTLTATIKPNHIPCIQIKNSLHFNGTEYLSEIVESTTLFMTNVDWELWNDHYDVEVESFNGWWSFTGSTGFFKNYIDKWTEVKQNNDGGLREIAKLHLNSLYGKFATNPDVTGKIPELDDDDVVRYRTGTPDTRDPVYTPMGVFITSYARDTTIRAAQRHYDVFAYADTDSLHLLAPQEEISLDVDPVLMGKWDHEISFDRAFFARAKQYTEQCSGPHKRCEGGRLHTAIAGLPTDIAAQVTFESFMYGEEFRGKKQPKRVKGGIVLIETTFRLRRHGEN